MECPLFKSVNLFTKGHCHLAFVKNHNNNIAGIITFEDVLQQLLRKEAIQRYKNYSINNENDRDDSKSENLCKKLYHKFKHSNTLEAPLVEEFQLAEKESSNIKVVIN